MTENSIGNESTMRNPSAEPASMGSMPTEGRTAVLGTIDRYELLSELGGGGFGSVYLARDTVAGVLVAVKGLPPLVKNIPEELERIRANFALVSQLSHPHIASLKVLHLAQHALYHDRSVKERLRVMPGDYMVVMEFAKGVTLSQWKRQFKDGRVPYELAVEICRQIAEALDYAHTQKIAHRDIKPSNIMVESFGEVRECENARVLKCGEKLDAEVVVKVLDFGLAAEIRSSMSRVSKDGGDTSGTRPYMAPEQWAGRKQGAATDQYALAVLFYELVSGGVPFASAFDTGDPVVMANAVENKVAEPVTELGKKMNAALLRGLAKGSGERFGSCGELVAALRGEKIIIHKRSQRAQRKRVVVALGVLGLVSVLSIFSIKSIRSNKAAAAVRAEQALVHKAEQERVAELEKEKQERISANLAKARNALEGKDYTAASTALSAVMADDRNNAEAQTLSDKVGRAAGLAGVVPVKVEAEKVSGSVAAFDKGQGFDKKLEALNTAKAVAEEYYNKEVYDKALTGYQRVLADANTLKDLELSRRGAEAQRDEAAKAKSIAEASNANTDAPELWPQGVELATGAKNEYEAGKFAEAKATWKQSAEAYAAANTHAVNVQGYQKAKAAYEAELGGPTSESAVLLATHGQAKWAAVKQSALQGAASSGDPTVGTKAYAAALAALPAALTEAQSIKSQFEEEQRIKKAAAEMAERVEAVEKALAAAGAAKAAGNWAQVKELLLALETAPADMGAKSIELTAAKQALLDEAVANLEPTLTIIAEAGGREIIATVTDSGGKAHPTPQTFTLKPDARYVFIVSIPSNQSDTLTPSKRYQPATFEVIADWRGAQTRRVTLEEITGPETGQAWKSKSTGMEFVWIPAMRMWVGKYEVTNGEYRKKVADHDSKDYKGHTLNGDRQPGVYVNYDDAVVYAKWLTEKDHANGSLPAEYSYRLPTEDEWMTFAQCGDGREYPWGNNWPPRSGQAGNYADKTAGAVFTSGTAIDGYSDGSVVSCSVEKSWANSWGLYGVGGNAWECASEKENGNFGAWRGASWNYDKQIGVRCSFRYCISGSTRIYVYGFRLVLSR